MPARLQLVALPALVSVAVLALAGCGDDDEASTATTAAGAGEGGSIEGQQWQLAEAAGFDLPADAPFTLVFADGEVSGSSGCNTYRGPYTVDGDRLTIGPDLATTMKACPEPVASAETAFLDALTSTTAYSLDGARLELRADADATLSFEAVDAGSLVGSWTAIGLLSREREAFSSLGQGTEITAAFGEDGSLAGSGGCNTYNASYTAEGTTISITQPAATLKACGEPAGVMEQEATYFQVLPQAASFTLEGDRLTLFDADGIRLVDYQRAG